MENTKWKAEGKQYYYETKLDSINWDLSDSFGEQSENREGEFKFNLPQFKNHNSPFKWVTNENDQMKNKHKTLFELKYQYYRPLREMKPADMSFEAENIHLESSNSLLNPLNTTIFKDKDCKVNQSTLRANQIWFDKNEDLNVNKYEIDSKESCNFHNITELKEVTTFDQNWWV